MVSFVKSVCAGNNGTVFQASGSEDPFQQLSEMERLPPLSGLWHHEKHPVSITGGIFALNTFCFQEPLFCTPLFLRLSWNRADGLEELVPGSEKGLRWNFRSWPGGKNRGANTSVRWRWREKSSFITLYKTMRRRRGRATTNWHSEQFVVSTFLKLKVAGFRPGAGWACANIYFSHYWADEIVLNFKNPQANVWQW